MLTANTIAVLQAALDTLSTIGWKYIAHPVHPPQAFACLGITVSYYASREYTEIGARKITRKVDRAHYEAECDIEGLSVWARGATRAAALRNLFKALRNAATVNAPTLRVPLDLCEPTKARAQARAERKANADRAWQIALDRAATAVEAERAAAPTIISPAPELRAVDSHDDSLHMRVGGYSRIVCNNLAPRFVEAPIVPADAAPGSEGIFKALLGLRTEDKIVALVNALYAAGVTIHRVEEDGCPIIRASMPDYHPQFGTITVLNL